MSFIGTEKLIADTLRSTQKWNLCPLKYPYRPGTKDNMLETEPLFSEPRHWLGCLLFLILAMLDGVYRLLMEKGNLLDTTASLFYIVGFGMKALTIHCHHKKSNEMVNFHREINTFLARHNTFPLDPLPGLTAISRGIHFINVNHISMAFLFGISCGINPMSEWRVLPIWIVGENGIFEVLSKWPGNAWIETVIKMTRHSFSFWYTYSVFKIYGNFGMINASMEMLVGTFTLQSSLMLLQRKAKDIKQEKDVTSFIPIYRQIQMLVQNYNENHSAYIFPAYVVISTFGIVISLYSIASRFHQLDYTTLGVFGDGLVVSLSELMLCFHWAKSIDFYSETIINRFGFSVKSFSSCSKKAARMYTKSMPNMRISIGSGNNYFDSGTPIILLDFAVNQAVSLILLEQ